MANYRQSGLPGFPPVIKYLIIINVVVWLLEILTGGSGSWIIRTFALYDIRSSLFKPFQFVSYMFLHEATSGGRIVFAHIFFNMFALWMFGSTLENFWGSKRFLNFYLICGIGAVIINMIIMYFHNTSLLHEYAGAIDQDTGIALRDEILNVPLYGASGAIFGVLVAFGYTFPNTEMFIIPIPFPIKAKWLVIGYILIELFGGVRATPGDDVAHYAHLGGGLVGFLIVFIWNRTNRRDFY
ncbi:rhomboid family intramembrane serine protease [Dinghuibacter silviterrae]|uniref:Membrane associated rhomboid family serine protease n=1 Tax=Dinghuibacter silviterrae TaxID=1539049 RepID=A0A4R8DQZ7_9BACT|nr:rhomboid family intramembrane serine protease [Dinghuibacter silviterrae]TDW99550.1 membrane associated rhomboid family serine protease [Dinghuibacter silviterrae]